MELSNAVLKVAHSALSASAADTVLVGLATTEGAAALVLPAADGSAAAPHALSPTRMTKPQSMPRGVFPFFFHNLHLVASAAPCG